jgi:hypothetical protein
MHLREKTAWDKSRDWLFLKPPIFGLLLDAAGVREYKPAIILNSGNDTAQSAEMASMA